MAEFDTSSLTKEQIAMAMKCKTADELIALAKKMGVVITKEQAEAIREAIKGTNLGTDPGADQDEQINELLMHTYRVICFLYKSL